MPAEPRERLLRAAIDVIAARGSSGASLSTIAQAAGTSKASVLYHFAGKDALLEATLATVLEGLVDRVAQAVSEAPSPGEAVFAYVRSMVGHLAGHPAHARAMTELLALEEVRGQGARRRETSRWQTLAGLVTEGQRTGELAPGDPVVAALLVGGAVDGLVGQAVADPDFDLAAASAELERLLRRALTERPAGAPGNVVPGG
jgi:AcrR family transcriptional regulator